MASASNSNCANNSNDLAVSIEKEHYYHGLLPREDVRLILDKNGDFVIRSTEPKPGEPRSYVLSVMFNNQLGDADAVKHFVINAANKKYFINNNLHFDTIQLMTCHYVKSNTEVQDGVKIIKPVRRQYWELEHDCITIQKKLGEGAFGEVSAGVMKFKRGNRTVQVAVKQAKLEKMGKEQIKDFMHEARMMRQLGHMNVVKFYGVAVLQEPLYLVMELASNGALDHYLKKNEDLPLEKRQEMLLQAAWGLEYLHGKPMIHRDIAARNCLYGDGKVKISDFGLTRKDSSYQMRPNTRAPIRWLAVETLRTQMNTQKTDVWAYGILCWEVYNNGAEPYPGMTTAEVLQQVTAGYRMPHLAHLSHEVQVLLSKCTAESPNDRPTMADIAATWQRITGIHRPNFAAIAKKEAEELLIMNVAGAPPGGKTGSTQKRRNKKQSTPKGM